MKAKICRNLEECGKEPGAIAFEANEKGLFFVCPCGVCGREGFLPFKGYGGGNAEWSWNGDRERPTLTPSIQRLVHCHWHGFLTNGEWESV